MSFSRTQNGTASGDRTGNLSIWSPMLYHFTTALPLFSICFHCLPLQIDKLCLILAGKIRTESAVTVRYCTGLAGITSITFIRRKIVDAKRQMDGYLTRRTTDAKHLEASWNKTSEII